MRADKEQQWLTNGQSKFLLTMVNFFFCECAAKVSVDAKSCPSCGDAKAKAKAEQRALATRPLWQKAIPWVIIAGIAFGVAQCVSSVGDGPSTCDKFALRDAAVQKEFGGTAYEAERDLRLNLGKTELGAGHIYMVEDNAGRKFRLIARAKNYGQEGVCQLTFTHKVRANDNWEAL